MASNFTAVDIDDLLVKIQTNEIGTAQSLHLCFSLQMKSDPVIRLQCASQLRDSIEGWKDQDAARFVSTGLPSILSFLFVGVPSFKKESREHLIRHTLLEVISRIPHVDGIKDQAAKITDLMLHILQVDNEENGVLCVKILIDMSRSFRASSERHVTAFTEIVKTLYQNMEGLIAEKFAENVTTMSADLLPSTKSFKVVAECPIATVLLFQAHRTVVNQAIRAILPSVVAVSIAPSYLLSGNTIFFSFCVYKRRSSNNATRWPKRRKRFGKV
jgi:transformation/transcription domain-associated protein